MLGPHMQTQQQKFVLAKGFYPFVGARYGVVFVAPDRLMTTSSTHA